MDPLEAPTPYVSPSQKGERGEEHRSFPPFLEPLDDRILEIHVVRHRSGKSALHIVHAPSIDRRITVQVSYC